MEGTHRPEQLGPVESQERAGPGWPTPRRTGILVVDDEAVIRSLLERVLRSLGFHVWLAQDGFEAVEIYRQQTQSIDLVLLDVRMAGRDGPQTLDELEAINPGLRCCFMSGFTGGYSAARLSRPSVVGFIKKPFQLAEVAEFLRRLAQ